MRKKIITMAVVIILLASLCLAEQWLVLRLTNGALEETRQILALIRAGDMEAAQEKTHALDRLWDEKAQMLEVLVDHSATDDVRYALSKLSAALESSDVSASLIYAGELEGGVEHVLERQELSIENVL